MEIVTGYRCNVIAMHTITEQLAWNHRHGLPEMNLPELLQELKKDILLFETILERIQDRRTKLVLRCRYALGYSIAETAEQLNVSHEIVDNVIKKLKQLSAAET